MSKLADEIIKKLFTDWKGKPVPRLIQEDTGGAGWSENAVRAVIKAAQHSVVSDVHTTTLTAFTSCSTPEDD